MNTKPMAKTAYINARIEPELKAEAESVFRELGVSTTDMITIFLRQVVMHKGLPFPLSIPNQETIEALAEDPTTLEGYTNSQAMMEDILSESD
ncbi:MAG: type II toxin-antitoxin system antitoxin, RelB/DinJ family [Hyphomicrobiales bacterium]|nr:MAG: type II toxin-antitoxin system antitoxin, RelB/DinJ family [Hyphomicrobiales bacterium]